MQKVLEMQARLKNTELHCALFSLEEMGEIRYTFRSLFLFVCCVDIAIDSLLRIIPKLRNALRKC